MRILLPFVVLFSLFLASCAGASSNGAALDTDTADSKQFASAPGKTEIPFGMSASRVTQLLGPADETENDASGRQIWRYARKYAGYVYYSGGGEKTPTLILGDYARDNPQGGLPFMLTIVFDPAKKVADFSFAQVGF